MAPCVYCSILNARLVYWLYINYILQDEQNGFRKLLIIFTSIIENRKLKKCSTFAAFVDFNRAYDTLNRNVLFPDLSQLSKSIKILCALKAIYKQIVL